MTLRRIKSYVVGHCEARIYRDAEWQEFRVRLFVNGALIHDADYHTDDKTNATATAETMARQAAASPFYAA